MSSVFWAPRSDETGGQLHLLCPRCEGDLEVHQPDADLPGRLLAICLDCKSWFLMDTDGDLEEIATD